MNEREEEQREIGLDIVNRDGSTWRRRTEVSDFDGRASFASQPGELVSEVFFEHVAEDLCWNHVLEFGSATADCETDVKSAHDLSRSMTSRHVVSAGWKMSFITLLEMFI